MGLLNFWKSEKPERPTIPVMEQEAITINDVEPAKQNEVVARQTLNLRQELAIRLYQLSRRSDELRSELARKTLNTL